MFYFQQLLNQGLAGIDGTAMIPTIVGIAYTILVVGFLIGLYQAAMRGGDVQALAVTGIKYLVVAIILANWTAVFHEVNDSFNQIARFIDSSSGAGDMFLSWLDQLKQQFSNNGFSAILPAISGTMAATITALMFVAAYLIYAMGVVVFGFFYVLYGCVLYVVGPLALALMPIAGVGQLAKSYATNLMIWNAWGILYATFASLITAIQFNRVDQVVNQGFLSGFFQGSSDSTVLGIVSIFYAIALVLIPFIAKRMICGDVGSSAYSLMRAGASAGGALMAGISGFAAGASAAETSTAMAAGAGAASSPGASSVAASISASVPPPQPSMAQTIRSGIMSAVNNAAPPIPSNRNTDQQAAAAAASSGSPFVSSGARRTPVPGVLRPIGVAQTVAFHAGKFAGSVMSGNGSREREGA
jgi:hypothetical protein